MAHGTAYRDQGMAQLIELLRKPAVRVGEAREARRRNCRWPALLVGEAHRLSCIVEDISTTGCRIRVASFRLKVGETVMLDIPSQGLMLDGQVIWKRHQEAGLKFGFTDASFSSHHAD